MDSSPLKKVCRLVCLLFSLSVIFFPFYLKTLENEKKHDRESLVVPLSIQTLDIKQFYMYPLNINYDNLTQTLLKGNKPRHKPIFDYKAGFKLEPKPCWKNVLGNKTWNSCLTNDTLDVLIIVKSTSTNFVQRQVVRSTWGKTGLFPDDLKLKLFFAIGCKNLTNLQVTLNNEFNTYNDIFQIDLIESYFRNTYKTMNIFHWIFKQRWKTKLVLIIDDDYYLNPVAFYDLIKQRFQKESTYLGFVGDPDPARSPSSKWYISYNEYPFNYYPYFHNGGFVLYDIKTLEKIYLAAEYVAWFRLDDVFIGFVAEKLKLNRQNLKHLCTFNSISFYFTLFFDFKSIVGCHCPGGYADLWIEYAIPMIKKRNWEK